MIKISKMPFERNSYIVSTNMNYTDLTRDYHWPKMAAWLEENEIEYSLQGNIIAFKDDMNGSLFAIRWTQ